MKNLVLSDQTYLYDFSYKKRVDLVGDLKFGSNNYKILVFGFKNKTKENNCEMNRIIDFSIASNFIPKPILFLFSVLRVSFYLIRFKGNLLVENLLSGFPLLFCNTNYTIDLHGDVVDELRILKGIGPLTIALLYRIEHILLRNSTEISVASNNYKKALEYRLGNEKNKLSVISNANHKKTISPTEYCDDFFEEFIFQNVGIIYSGSSLKWQNPESMLTFFDKIYTISKKYRLVILSKEKLDFEFLVNEKFSHLKDYIYISSVSHLNVDYYYQRCKFGLIFRDFSRTNFVSCPTKLMEYAISELSILYTGYIGDFEDLNKDNPSLISCNSFEISVSELLLKMEANLNVVGKGFIYN